MKRDPNRCKACTCGTCDKHGHCPEHCKLEPLCFLVADQPLKSAPWHPQRAVIRVVATSRLVDFEGFQAVESDAALRKLDADTFGFPERFSERVKARARRAKLTGTLPWRRFSIVSALPIGSHTGSQRSPRPVQRRNPVGTGGRA